MTIVLELCVGIHRVYDGSGVQERQFITEKLEWLSSLEIGPKTNLAISATSRLWEYANYLLKGFQSDQQSQDWLEIQPCVKFIAGLVAKGALLSSSKPDGGQQREHSSEYMIQIAFLAAEPELFIYLLRQQLSLDPLKLWTGSLPGWKYKPDEILINAATINDLEGIRSRWPYRLHNCSMEPSHELFLTVTQPEIQPRKVEEIILRYLHLKLNPVIRFIDLESTRSWTNETLHRSQEEVVCFDALNSILYSFFETPGHGIAAGAHPAAIKSLHRDTMHLIMQHPRNRDLFEKFFKYGAKAERIPYSKTICNMTRGIGRPSFMNISFETIRNYAAENTSILRALIQADESVNQAWFQPELFLMTAVRDGNMNMAIWLLDQRVNHPEKCRNKSLKHAVRLAVMRGRIDIVALLLESDPSCRDSALDIAVEKSKYAFAEMIRSWKPGMLHQSMDTVPQAGGPQDERLDTFAREDTLQSPSLMIAKHTNTSRANARAVDDDIDAVRKEPETEMLDNISTGLQHVSNADADGEETLSRGFSSENQGEFLGGYFWEDLLPWDSDTTFLTRGAEDGMTLDDTQEWDIRDFI